MLAMFMAAIEATIVSTAMPAIVADLGGFSLYSWVFSSYLLMNAVTILIYGKLSDLFGRKPVIVFGIVIFLIGSILCGLADSMTMLIISRFIQGFGAGAVMPIATTIVGDIYTKEERAKVQGYLSSVWGISAILGPAIGGLLVQYVSWRTVFLINVPLGILAIAGIVKYLDENIEKKKQKIDYAGAILLTIGISVFMVLFVEAGTNWAWNSLPVIGLAAIGTGVLALFYFQEKTAEEPMMPFVIWKQRTILIANLASFTTGMMLIGLSSFLPAYVQGVMERTPIVAGFALTSMSIGWPIAATVAGRLLLKIGYRTTSIMGGGFLLAGSSILLTLSPEAGPLWAALGSFVIGLGMGMITTSFIVTIQSTVSWETRGAATASNMFMRTLGNTVGAALLGGVLNSRLQAYFQEQGYADNLDLNSTNELLDPARRAQLDEQLRVTLQEGLTIGLHSVYLIVFVFAVISMALVFFLPRKEEN
ncbi:MFS transporter [Bacillus lacus]|uniref:MFS transporter n=1 Tax=Metabacillus lacus TaxID=1983721 RepID=A0A7X2LYA0_9BACI|nr:MDR family MFS transporter [Metabacillus lacus]MRX71573.1 MFS transporter [Metabacillus lacus]